MSNSRLLSTLVGAMLLVMAPSASEAQSALMNELSQAPAAEDITCADLAELSDDAQIVVLTAAASYVMGVQGMAFSDTVMEAEINAMIEGCANGPNALLFDVISELAY